MSKRVQSGDQARVKPRQAAYRVLALLLLSIPSAQTGGKETSVYRCIVEGAAVEFRQQPCAKGKQQRLEVEDRRVGWKAPVRTRESRAKKSRPEPRKSGVSSDSGKRKEEKECWKTRARLERIEWRMRRGYKAGQGAGLRQRLREYEDYLSRFC